METTFLYTCMTLATFFLGASLILVMMRLYKGPSLADRVIAVDLFGTILLSAILLFTVIRSNQFYLDVALIFALFSFLGMVIFARFIESRGKREQL